MDINIKNKSKYLKLSIQFQQGKEEHCYIFSESLNVHASNNIYTISFDQMVETNFDLKLSPQDGFILQYMKRVPVEIISCGDAPRITLLKLEGDEGSVSIDEDIFYISKEGAIAAYEKEKEDREKEECLEKTAQKRKYWRKLW
jgi:hypothetical protein